MTVARFCVVERKVRLCSAVNCALASTSTRPLFSTVTLAVLLPTSMPPPVSPSDFAVALPSAMASTVMSVAFSFASLPIVMPTVGVEVARVVAPLTDKSPPPTPVAVAAASPLAAPSAPWLAVTMIFPPAAITALASTEVATTGAITVVAFSVLIFTAPAPKLLDAASAPLPASA